MTMQPGWVPPGIDTETANIARVYDWWLGGDHNFRADQDAARAMIAVEPNADHPERFWFLAGVSQLDQR
jgi:S-adenosyl methyltransferase